VEKQAEDNNQPVSTVARYPFWNQLELKGSTIRERWFRLIVDTYPPDSTGFLRQEKDSLLNPVGRIILQEIEVIFDELVHKMRVERLKIALDRIIRIRSVQEFQPSQAVSFIYLLKRVIIDEFSGNLAEPGVIKEMLDFEARIDKLAMHAFDIYMSCREKMYEIRANELIAEKEQALTILARVSENYKQIE
jgi:hypothetical protein